MLSANYRIWRKVTVLLFVPSPANIKTANNNKEDAERNYQRPIRENIFPLVPSTGGFLLDVAGGGGATATT